MPELEARLRTSLADSAQRFEAGPDFAETVNRRATALRRRRLATIGVVSASSMAVAVVVVLALVGLGGGRDPGGRVTVDATGRGTDGPRATGRGTDGSPATAPPSGYADSGYRLWFNATVIPTDGADMAAALVNSGGPEATFGIGAWLDRWDGDSWARHRWVSLCLDHWFCAGRLEDVEGAHGVRDIGLVAGPGRPGPLERFRADGLDPGWYRLTQEANEGVVAGGVFEVREGAPEPAPLDDPSAPSISVSPILVPSTGDEVRLAALVPPADVATAVQGLSETASVERREGGGWQAVATADLRSGAGDPAGSTDRVVQIPPLDPGDYRIVRSAPGGATHAGRFWVVSPSALGVVGASTDAGNDAVSARR